MLVVDDIGEVGYKVLSGDQVETIVFDENPTPLYELQHWQYECPALIFVYLPENRTDLYDCVKLMCDLEFGINSQCIVQETAKRQSGHKLDQL